MFKKVSISFVALSYFLDAFLGLYGNLLNWWLFGWEVGSRGHFISENTSLNYSLPAPLSGDGYMRETLEASSVMMPHLCLLSELCVRHTGEQILVE